MLRTIKAIIMMQYQKRTLLIVAAFLFFTKINLAQTQTAKSSSEILQQIKKLNTVGSVLYIAAHPDDENTRLLAYLANEKKLRTGYLSLTRGDGGQNLIGKEQGEMLGLIRTQELLAARRTDGAEQFFSRAYDFGYSKNPEETFSFWNKDSVLSDVVWVIRKFRPDVIICRFPTTGEGGHGHHTASAILALEAFEAAADPKRFPEQLKFVEPWKTRRIFWNTFNFGGLNTTSESQIKIDVGGFNNLLGKSYGEIAAESRSNHKSQGFGSAKTRGETFEYFKQLGGDTARKDIFEGINQTWARVSQEAKIKTLLDNCIAQYNVNAPEKSLTTLVKIYNELNQQTGKQNNNITKVKSQKIDELKQIILNCAGLWIEATAADYMAVPGKKIDLTTSIICRNKAAVKINHIHFLSTDTNANLTLQKNKFYTFKSSEILDSKTNYSTPYWLANPHTKGAFVVNDQLKIGADENNPALKVIVECNIEGTTFDFGIPVVYKSTDPVKGEQYRPFEILPPATVNTKGSVYVFVNGKAKKINFVIKANTENLKGKLALKVNEGWSVSIDNPEFQLSNKNEEVTIQASIIPNENTNEATIAASLIIDDKVYEKSIKRINYDHIPAQFTLEDAHTKLINIPLKRTGKNIGYINGAGDDVAACLEQIGYSVTLLDDAALANKSLENFDAIVTGVRAYNTNEKLQLYHKKLMRYVKNGGNLIVQYNTNNRISSVPQQIGPYPFTITRQRVTDENAVMNITKPEHALFNYPNKIDTKDFENWIQERGIYFAVDSAKKYETVFSITDPNEQANEGSLLIAKYGAGNFVYTGLAFFRELPAGVPGAYRLFVNLLSLPQNEPKKD